MLSYIFLIWTILGGLMSLFFSKNKRVLKKLEENFGQEDAIKANRVLRICGYILLVCGGFWFVIILWDEFL